MVKKSINGWTRVTALVIAVLICVPFMLISSTEVNAASDSDEYHTITLPLFYNGEKNGTIELFVWESTYYIAIDDLCKLTRSEQVVNDNTITIKQGIWPATFDTERNTFDDGYQQYDVDILKLSDNSYAVPALMFLSYFKAVPLITDTKMYCEMKDFTAWEALDIDYENTLVDIYELYGGEDKVSAHLTIAMLMDLILGDLTNVESYMNDAYSCVLRVDLNNYNAVKDYVIQRNELLQKRVNSEVVSNFIDDLKDVYPIASEPLNWIIDFYYRNIETDFSNLLYSAKAAGKKVDADYYTEMLYETLEAKNASEAQAKSLFTNAEFVMMAMSAAIETAQDIKYMTATDNIIYKVMGTENVKELGISVEDGSWYDLAHNYKNILGVASKNIEEEAKQFYVSSWEDFMAIVALGNTVSAVYSWSLDLGRVLVEAFPLTSTSIADSKADMRAMFLSDLQNYVYRVLYNTLVKLNEDRGSEDLFEKVILATQLYCRTSIAMYENLIGSLDEFTSDRKAWESYFQDRIDYLAVKMYQLTLLQGDAVITCLPMDLPTFTCEKVDVSKIKSEKKLTQINYYEDYLCRQENLRYNEDGLLTHHTSDYYSTSGEYHYSYTFSYNDHGQLIQSIETNKGYPCIKYEYNQNGQMIGWSQWEYSTTDGEEKYICEYNAAGQKIRDLSADGSNETVYTYDSNGRMVSKNSRHVYGDMSGTTDVSMSYDNEGNLSEQTVISDWGFGEPSVETYVYNYNHKPFTSISTYSNGSLISSSLNYEFYKHNTSDESVSFTFDESAKFEFQDGYLIRVTGSDYTYEFFYDGETDESFTSKIPARRYEDEITGDYISDYTDVKITITATNSSDYRLTYTASGVTLENIPLAYFNENTSTRKMIMFDVDALYPEYSGYIEFVWGSESIFGPYSFNALIDGLAGTEGDYYPLKKVGVFIPAN